MKHRIRINGEIKEYNDLSEDDRKWLIANYTEYMNERMAGYSKNSKRHLNSNSRVNFLGDKIKCI
ncbi:MAG: hypothetical protein IJQ82_08365 [Selenomonadaceae bacterium]|nr:hypothetical protein [Selenomonadaceae bacterium]